MTLSLLLAEDAAQQQAFNPMMLVLLALFAVMIFMMFRNRKKATAAAEERKNQLVPGAEIMTTAGIYGTVSSIDTEQNRLVLEVSPGQLVTFDMRAVAQVVSSPKAVISDSPADAAAALSAEADEAERAKREQDGENGTDRNRD
ncbi:MAG: preprotein translocase subunit YajC [Arthrobacter sp.]|nr:preprotein translocase subunit YajC [Arthrobacter sp.]